MKTIKIENRLAVRILKSENVSPMTLLQGAVLLKSGARMYFDGTKHPKISGYAADGRDVDCYFK